MKSLLLFALLVVALRSHAETSVTVASLPGFPGTTVSVAVNLRQVTNVTAAQFDITFDPARVASGAVVQGALWSNHVFRAREIAPGVIRVLAFSRVNASVTVTNSVAALNLPFTIPATEYVGSGPISPENVLLARPNATVVAPVALTPGAIFVRPVNPLPSGQVQFFLPSDPDQHYLIQASTNLVDWINLTNMTASSSFMDLIDADGGLYPHRFYRSALYNAIEGGFIGDFARSSNGEVTFHLVGLEGRAYIIQVSANLVDWEDLRLVTASNGKLLVSDAQAAIHPTRFYRLRSE